MKKLFPFPAALFTALALLSLGASCCWATLVEQADGTVYASNAKLYWTKDANLLKTLSLQDQDLIGKIIRAVPGGFIKNSPNYFDRGEHKLSKDDFQFVFNSVSVWYDSANWWGAQAFVIYLNSIHYSGHSDWRLPSVHPINGQMFQYDSSFTGDTDVGYNISSLQSELAYLFYVELGNKGYYRPEGVPWPAGTGMTHKRMFQQLVEEAYWAAEEYAPRANDAWNFAVVTGEQSGYGKNHMYGIWPVRSEELRAALSSLIFEREI